MITVSGLTKNYGSGNRNAVDQISFNIPEGMLFTLLGASGCGKSTTLRMIAGLEDPTEGEIKLGDQIVYSSAKGINVPTNKRPIGMVFQSYAIWPHMSVMENVAFPLTIQRLKKAEVAERTMEVLRIVGMEQHAKRSATALSGGQQQRIALARALIREPRVLLLDEPLSNLDAKLREQMRDEIRLIQQKTGITAIFVTHDQSEALAISDLVMLMGKGKILELGSPVNIYRHPNSIYGAQFIGISNQFNGEVKEVSGNHIDVAVGVGSGNKNLGCITEKSFAQGSQVSVFIRPEDIVFEGEPSESKSWSGKIVQAFFQGDAWDYTVDVDGQAIRVRSYKKHFSYKRGDLVQLSWVPDRCIVLEQETEQEIEAADNKKDH